MSNYLITDYGALGDGSTNDAQAIQKAINACTEAGGGRVVIPAGRTFMAGSFEIKSNVELHLEAGSRLRSTAQREDFALNEEFQRPMWIWATNAQNIALTGLGVIDGNCLAFATETLPHIYKAVGWRPAMTFFVGCRNIRVTHLTLRDAAFWALHFAGCEDIVVHGVTIKNEMQFPNCDGIDPDHCRNVRISDCHIEAGDDCIVLKTTRPFARFGPTENVTVTGCTLRSQSAAIKLGTESVGDFRNIVFDACVITGSHRGLAIQLRDEGNVDNVIFSNMIVETQHFQPDWWGAAEPIYITAFPRKDGVKVGRIRNVRFSNVLCRSENGAVIAGTPGSEIENITLDNVRLEIARWTDWQGDYIDRRPCAGEGVTHRPIPAVLCQHARRVTLRHCEVAWADNLPNYLSHALEAQNCPNLKLDDFTGAAARENVDAISIDA